MPTTYYAGLLVTARPAGLAACLAALHALDGAEVHHVERATGRVIVVDETTILEDYERRLQRFRQLPEVIDVRLVVHHVDHAAGSQHPVAVDGAEVEHR